MKDRIKMVRKAAGLSQTDFGKAINVTRSAVQKWELGENGPTPQAQYVICQRFKINPGWLETGEGDMLDPKMESDIEAITRAMHGQSEGKKRLMRILADMPDDLLDKMLEYLESCVSQEKKERP